MATGHYHTAGEDNSYLNSQVIDRLLKNEEVRKYLHSFPSISRDYDLPYLGGYSKDGKTIYFDRHLPYTLSYIHDGQKKSFDPTQHILDHECFEKALIDVLGWNYEHAHHAANGYERRGVLRAGLLWIPYNSAYDPYLKNDEHEKLKKVPADLDMTPYTFPPVDKALLARMKKAM